MPTYHPGTQQGVVEAGVLPERGNPICALALFLVQDVGTQSREGSARRPAAALAQVTALPRQAPASHPFVRFSSKASSQRCAGF